MMFRFLPYILKCLWGHRGRTVLTISGSAVAIFVFCFVGSVQEGLRRLSSDEDAQRRLIVFQENRFCPTSSRLPEDYARQIREISGVRDVLPVQVWTNNCRASLDVVVFHGVPRDQLRRAKHMSLIAGSWDAFASRRDGALVGQHIAQRRNLRPGDQFTLGDVSVHVAGVFASPVPAEEYLIYTDLAFLQYTRNRDTAGLVTLHEVQLTDQADPDAVARAIDASFQGGPVATTTRRKGAFQTSTLADLVDLIGFTHWLGMACLGLVLGLVATTTVMSVHDRVAEYALLQTLGMRPSKVFRLVVAESVLLSTIGGLIGTALAIAMLTRGGFAVGAEGVAIAFRATWRLAATGVLLSIIVGVLASLAPALQAARTPLRGVRSQE